MEEVPQRERIAQIDVLRGIAILGIVFLNLPVAATTIAAAFEFPYLAGWAPADRIAWTVLEVGIEGTQRGILEFLFGAGMLILTAPAMQDDGPVRIADLYFRRNLWLLGFGLINAFVLLFPGDILFIYAVAALFLFPFRRLGPKALMALGLGFVLVAAVHGGLRYAERAALVDRVAAAPADPQVRTAWEAALRETRPNQEFIAADTAGRRGSVGEYVKLMHKFWIERGRSLELFFWSIPEAFAAMLIGAALFKWRILQGERSRRFYLLLMGSAYALGLLLRWIELTERLAYGPGPRISWITEEAARIAMSVGHVAALSLLLKCRAGTWLLRPFQAAGRTAFSLYLMQCLIMMWLLFPAFGLGLWGTLSWAEMAAASLAIAAVQLVLANLWLRRFAVGPVEWLWRSLVHWRRRPFLRRDGEPPPLGFSRSPR